MPVDPLEGADLAQPSILSQVAAATGQSDQQLAVILGVSRATVNIWRNNRSPERYDKAQRQALWNLLMRQRVLLGAAIARITS